jgi:tRNA A37 threonylcarbamoyladenosine biosynthesis protein TsaE
MNPEDNTIYTNAGNVVKPLNINPKSYIDKTIAIYGCTRSGKTVITKNIMKILNNYIDQILVISPSEPSNRSYEGYVDSPFIHYKLYISDPNDTGKKDNWKEKSFVFLESIWARQELMASIYNRSNKIDVLESLFYKIVLHIREEAECVISNMKKKCNIAIEQIKKQYEIVGIREAKIKDITDKFNDIMIQIYKKYIHIDYENIWKMDLNEDERYSLQYLCFNPRLLLIFDDCAASLKPFFTKEIFRKLFYQNRHSYITVIISVQDDTDIPANLRKNAFINFYTEPIVCSSNFERTSNKYSRHTKSYVNDIIPYVFNGFRKLAYIRETEQFYHVTFEIPESFKFGSIAMQELCNSVENKETSMDKENIYYNYFKIENT